MCLFLFSDLKKVFASPYASDISFSIQGTIIPAHKAILSARSEYFYAMFTGNMMEASSNIIELDNVSYECFIKGLEFIYTSTMSNINELSSETVIELLELVKRIFRANSHFFL